MKNRKVKESAREQTSLLGCGDVGDENRQFYTSETENTEDLLPLITERSESSKNTKFLLRP